MLLRSAFAASAVALVTACSSPPPPPPAAPDATAIPNIAFAEFPVLTRTGHGFDPSSADAAWSSDDRVDFLLRLTKGDTERRWIVRLSPLLDETMVERMLAGDGPAMGRRKTWNYSVGTGSEKRALTLESLQLPMTVHVADENGAQLSATLIELPATLLGHGVLPAIDAAKNAIAADATTSPSTADEARVRPYVESTIAMMSLLKTLQENEALADYFWQVVEKPSFLSVLTSFGVAATMNANFEKAVPVTLPPHLPAAERAFVVPMQIDVNGSPALLVDVVAIDAARPFAVCGGMIAAVARHPSKDIRLEVQLVTARCTKPAK